MLFAISSPGNSLDAALLDKINNKTKPLGALGQLEQLALQIGRMQKTLTPAPTSPQIPGFAGEHGAAKPGVSALKPGASTKRARSTPSSIEPCCAPDRQYR